MFVCNIHAHVYTGVCNSQICLSHICSTSTLPPLRHISLNLSTQHKYLAFYGGNGKFSIIFILCILVFCLYVCMYVWGCQSHWNCNYRQVMNCHLGAGNWTLVLSAAEPSLLAQVMDIWTQVFMTVHQVHLLAEHLSSHFFSVFKAPTFPRLVLQVEAEQSGIHKRMNTKLLYLYQFLIRHWVTKGLLWKARQWNMSVIPKLGRWR